MVSKIEDLIRASRESAKRHQRVMDAAKATAAAIAVAAPTQQTMAAGEQQTTGTYGGGQR